MRRAETDITSLSLRRPVMTVVGNLLIILAGVASVLGVDVRELPDVDRPVVSVRATFDGASPNTMDTEVTSVLEGAVARVSGVREIGSSSEENNMRMRVEFQPGYDLDTAANDVREAVSRVQRDLPDDIDQVLVYKADDDSDPIIQLAAFSDTLSIEELASRVEKDVAPEFLSIEGVADVRLDGNRRRVLRILLDPARMAALRVAASEVIETMRGARFDVPAGSYKSEDQELIVRAHATVVEPDAVARLPVRDNVRIGDVADVFYGPEQAESYTLLNGRNVVGLGVVRRAGSNTITISDEVKRRLARINERSPDFELAVTSDDSVFIKGALAEVLWTLALSVLFVLLVIGVFLGRLSAVIVPAVTMPVSLVGTLAAIWLLGFSVNLLTLLALVLATGLIVDDAIVVLENIQRRRAEGLEPLAAAVLGTRQVFFAVVATTVTLVAVFLPIAFLPGQTGQLFREFGLVLVIAVIISSFVAVTLCPLLAARLGDTAEPTGVLGALQVGLGRAGTRASAVYFATLRAVLAWPFASLIVALALAVAGVLGFSQLDQELLPVEDRGQLVAVLTGPDGASLRYSGVQAEKMEAVLHPYQDAGLITDIYTIVGRWDKNRVFVSAGLQDWDERTIGQTELAAQINPALRALPGGQVRIRQGNSLNLRGGGGGLDLALLGNDYEDILAAAVAYAAALEERVPGVNGVTIQFDTSQPELGFLIDRERARDLDVPMDHIAQTLRAMVDEYDVLDLNVEDQAVPVLLGSKRGTVRDPNDLLDIFVTNRTGEPVPLGSLLTVQERGVAAELDRRAQRRAIDVDVSLDPGSPLGEVLADARDVARDVLPPNVQLLARGEAATLEETSYEVALTFLIALLVVFLVLAAQFESFGSALIVIFTVPFGLAAAVFALLWTGQTLNLYSQIGLVMLVGLMTKNAILLVEFMDQLRDGGMDVPDAIMEGVRIRLRPVLMTVLSTVLSSLPLILGEGPGAEARQAIGWVIFGGLGLSTGFTLYLTPLGYRLIAPYVKPRALAGKELEAQLARASP